MDNNRVLWLTGLATVSLIDKEYALAEKYLTEALTNRPQDNSVVLYYGYTMYLQGKQKDAVRYVKAHAVGVGELPYGELAYLLGAERFIELVKQS